MYALWLTSNGYVKEKVGYVKSKNVENIKKQNKKQTNLIL